MNMLDKLFSREIERRTGAHAINIYIEENSKKRKRSRSIGANALSNANQPKITTKQAKGSFLHRLDIRFPWLKLVAVCLLGIVAVLDLCDLTISRVRDPSSKIRIAPMSKHIRATERILEGKMLVALTFDDGPSDTTTPILLDTLFQKDVPVTFFNLGNMAKNNPDIVKRAQKEGHEVASHTMYHQNLIRIPASAAEADINEAKKVLSDITGHSPIYTRPPYGNTNSTVRDAIKTPIILWSVDTEDWKSKNPELIVKTAMSQIHDGAIILMHDIYPTTVEAVPTLIDTIRSAGYEFVTISELAKARSVTLSPGTVYYNLRP